MKITINLSEESINAAIRKLQDAQRNIEYGINQTVEMLVKEGADVAQAADGAMATVVGYMDSESVGEIVAVGEAPVIAEFGAGDATIDPEKYFTNYPPVPVYPGSFSESEKGSGMYAEYGWWKFGGNVYRKVEPRQGLYRAKEFIQENAADYAKEVIKL